MASDPLTVSEQEDLCRQLERGAMRSGTCLLPSELENIYRLAATLQFYHGLLEAQGIKPDEALPQRVTIRGIAWLKDSSPKGTA